MNPHTEKLEGLLYAQAMSLARQHRQKADEAIRQIEQALEARLGRREEGEAQRYQLEAELRCRQLIQAARLRIDSEHDRLRWTLAQDVLHEVGTRLEALSRDTARYHGVLEGYLAEAVRAIPEGDLVAELNPRDLDVLHPVWRALVERAAPGRTVALGALADHVTGGMRVRSADGRLRVDNTFEGRLERLRDEVLRGVMDRLFGQTDGEA